MQHDGIVITAEFNHDGTQVVTASDDTARVWDANTGQLIGSLEYGTRTGIQKVIWSADQLLVVSSWFVHRISQIDNSSFEMTGKDIEALNPNNLQEIGKRESQERTSAILFTTVRSENIDLSDAATVKKELIKSFSLRETQDGDFEYPHFVDEKSRAPRDGQF